MPRAKTAVIASLLPALCTVLVGTTAWAQATDISPNSLSSGVYYSQGNYGAPLDTTIRYLPLSYSHQGDTWGFSVTVPYVQIEGLGNALVNVGGVTRARLANRRVDESGLGDVVTALTYQFPSTGENGPFIDLVMEVKIPTADEKRGLGTGETDYSLQLDFFQPLGNVTAFGTGGYRQRGRTELFAGLQDSPFAELGLNFPLSEVISGGLIYSYSAPASDASTEIHEILPYLNWNFHARWALMIYGIKGFTTDSPDVAAGVQLTVRW